MVKIPGKKSGKFRKKKMRSLKVQVVRTFFLEKKSKFVILFCDFLKRVKNGFFGHFWKKSCLKRLFDHKSELLT